MTSSFSKTKRPEIYLHLSVGNVRTAMQTRVEALNGGAERLRSREHLLEKSPYRGGKRKHPGIVRVAVVGEKKFIAATEILNRNRSEKIKIEW